MSSSNRQHKLPKEIKVLGLDYEIKEYEDNLTVKDAGFTHVHGNLISITTGMKPKQQACTLLHEVLHAVFAEMGMHNSPIKDGEEYIVECFSNGLIQIIRDNPELIAFLQESLNGRK